MKTLICIPCLLTGGTEIQTLNTVHALVQGGHEVTVACYFEHTPDMVARYRKAGAEVILFSPEGVRVGGYKSILFLYKHLRRAIRVVRPDVTHVQYMAPGATVILLLWLMGVKNIIATAHTAADIYRDLRLIHFLQRHSLRAFTCITERAERSFFGSSQLYTPETTLGRRNHFTIYNALPFRSSERHAVNVPSARLDVAGRQVSCDESQVNVAGQRLDVAGRQVNCDESQVNAAGQRLDVVERQVNCDESQANAVGQRLDVAERQVNCDESQVNAAGQRLDVSGRQVSCDESQVNAAGQRLDVAGRQVSCDESQVNAAGQRLDVAGRQVNCDESQVNAAGQRLDVAERQVNCDESQVNAAGQRLDVAGRQVKCDESLVNAVEQQVNVPSAQLGDNQSQSDDPPATSLRFTSNSVAIHRSEAAPVLGVVSRLEPIKGMDLVVPAFAEVLGAHPEVRLLVVGDGTLRASMEEQAAALGCAEAITFVGRQPQEQLAQWYRQMDIVLMPSRSEGFGLTAIEAMASGCVMVASDVGGLPEVVRDGICGLLHRTEDVTDMASKISSLIGDEALYDRLQAQSLVEVEKYSFERYADAVCDLYERLRR